MSHSDSLPATACFLSVPGVLLSWNSEQGLIKQGEILLIIVLSRDPGY